MAASKISSPIKIEVAAAPQADVDHLKSQLGIGPYLAKCLIRRGLSDPDLADKFLNPKLSHFHDSALLPDFSTAKQIIFGAIEGKQPIFLNGDYDADGITSTSIFARCLSKMGAVIEPYIPQRATGFGISKDAVIDAYKRGARVLLSCDCGSSSVESVSIAKEMGMKTVVTDHHLPGPVLPPSDAIINPHLDSATYPFRELSGAGVVFKFLYGLMAEKGLQERFADHYLDLAAIGTIADVVPLVDENRIISALGIPKILTSNKLGIKALLQQADPKGTITPHRRTGWDSLVSFRIAPRINSGGRIADAYKPLKLFLSADWEESSAISLELEKLNAQRKGLVDAIVTELDERVQKPGLFIVEGSKSWNPGVVGIAASRIAEKHNRPAMIFGWDETSQHYKGSMRTLGLIHAQKVIENAKTLISGGGHAAAAGGTLMHGSLEELRENFVAFAAQSLQPDQLIRTYTADFEVDPGSFTIKDAEELQLLEPTGAHNPSVLALIKQATVTAVIPLGKNQEHAKFMVQTPSGKTATVLAWGVANRVVPRTGDKVNILARPSINEFNGDRSVQWVAEIFEPVAL